MCAGKVQWVLKTLYAKVERPKIEIAMKAFDMSTSVHLPEISLRHCRKFYQRAPFALGQVIRSGSCFKSVALRLV